MAPRVALRAERQVDEGLAAAALFRQGRQRVGKRVGARQRGVGALADDAADFGHDGFGGTRGVDFRPGPLDARQPQPASFSIAW